uniref:Putative methyltransferase n=1 Tax=viral metagenome TaxID=1070528 RepID=A0A6M3L5L0_9ZZZZ
MNNSDKIILSLCGGSGSWEKPYKDAGYSVVNVTLPGYDVRTYQPPANVYGILAAPPCTHFSFARTNAKVMRDLRGAIKIVSACMNIIWKLQEKPISNTAKYTRLKFWALENPYFGLLKNFIGKPCFVFDPWEFGDGYQKKTALWGNFKEPKKKPGPMTDDMKKLAKTNSYLHKKKFDYLLNDEIHPEQLGVLDGQARRAITPPGFAQAFFKANR